MEAHALQEARLRALRFLTPALALLYLGAGVLHAGLRVPLGFATLGFPEPVAAATLAESLIGTALAAAAVMLFRAPARTHPVVVGVYGLSLVFTIVGTVVGPQGVPDRVVHIVMLAGVLAGLALLLQSRKSRAANTRGGMQHR